MAREVKEVELYGGNNGGDKRRLTCASGVAITKGTILKLTDARTASASTGTGDVFAGIASMDKDSADTSTSISAWENGIFEMVASGAITVGAKVKTASDGNYVMQCQTADVQSSYAIIVGTALETASDGETINVRVNN